MHCTKCGFALEIAHPKQVLPSEVEQLRNELEAERLKSRLPNELVEKLIYIRKYYVLLDELRRLCEDILVEVEKHSDGVQKL
jgi:hypothetical protein